MGEAREQFNREKREVVVRGFRSLGISLPIDGPCDDETSIKGLNAKALAEGLRNWELTPSAQAVDSSAGGTSNDPETDSSDEDEILSFNRPKPTHCWRLALGVLGACALALGVLSVCVLALGVLSTCALAHGVLSARTYALGLGVTVLGVLGACTLALGVLGILGVCTLARRPCRAQTRESYLLNQF